MAGTRESASGPERLRFGLCPNCAYAATGTPEFCFECASSVVDQIPGRRCPTCDGSLQDNGGCGNPMCSWPVEQRGWRYVYALAARSGVLETVINRYKYEDIKGWAWIFARLLVGYLDENFTPGEDHQLIISSPTFVGAEGRSWDHTGLVLERAQKEDGRWPFATDVVVKTGLSPKMVGLSWRERSDAARYQLAPLLKVPDRSVVEGKDVLLYDDVFTTGTTLREVAHKLHGAGATSVDVVVLGRQPFRG